MKNKENIIYYGMLDDENPYRGYAHIFNYYRRKNKIHMRTCEGYHLTFTFNNVFNTKKCIKQLKIAKMIKQVLDKE